MFCEIYGHDISLELFTVSNGLNYEKRDHDQYLHISTKYVCHEI